ncbi:MAG: phytanoyl-CoA dioxygenase family protein, partial [Aquihabitans sp.]
DADLLASAGAASFGFLGSDEVRAARAIADSLHIDPDTPFYTSNAHADRDDATRVSDQLLELTAGAVARTLPGRRAVTAVVLAKGACGNNWVNPHQDWDYVDERLHRAHVLWCPLGDVGAADGPLHVIPGSHRWSDHRRGSGAFPMPFEPFNDVLTTAGEAFELHAGEAVMYDHAAVHYSPPNDGSGTRLVIGLVIVPVEATVIHLHSTDGQTAERFAVDPAFFTTAPFMSRPPGPADAIVPIGGAPFGRTEIDAWLRSDAG